MSAVLDLAAPLTNRGPRLSDLVFERLAEAIVQGVLAPGELLRDQALAAQLGVSRMPVREALQRLERAGLVEMSASRYTRVAVFPPERVAAGLEYAGFLYGSALRMATARMSAEARHEAVELLDELLVAAAPERCRDAATRFFRFAMTHTGNEVWAHRGDMSYLIPRILREVPVTTVASRVRRHRQALRDAVAAGDADAAEAAVRRMFGVA